MLASRRVPTENGSNSSNSIHLSLESLEKTSRVEPVGVVRCIMHSHMIRSGLMSRGQLCDDRENPEVPKGLRHTVAIFEWIRMFHYLLSRVP